MFLCPASVHWPCTVQQLTSVQFVVVHNIHFAAVYCSTSSTNTTVVDAATPNQLAAPTTAPETAITLGTADPLQTGVESSPVSSFRYAIELKLFKRISQKCFCYSGKCFK